MQQSYWLSTLEGLASFAVHSPAPGSFCELLPKPIPDHLCRTVLGLFVLALQCVVSFSLSVRAEHGDLLLSSSPASHRSTYLSFYSLSHDIVRYISSSL